ncbi:MAG: hypothetical protein NVSMB15_03430 [Steroidobacteraceae bacterium]
MHSPDTGYQRPLASLSLALLAAALWLSTHGYHGLTGDAQIYAFQALARIRSALAADLYLQNTSQDQFTIFSPVYAWFIGLFGLEHAARLLTLLFTAWLVLAAWIFVGAIAGRNAAWLAVAFLLIVAGDYGAAGVFRFPEQFLTARLPAEALIVTALACHGRGKRLVSLLPAAAALFIHPLMALPGLLLLICLQLPGRASLIAAFAGAFGVLVLAITAALYPGATLVLPLMDTAWLDVVRERSQFLFLQLWSFHDWDVNARPLIYLGFTAIAVPDERLRKLCAATALVGVTGLGVALIASVIGPVALLVQGQAWRWVWIAVLISALWLPFTALQVWRDASCGPLCALLLIAGWTFPAVDGTACVSLALFFWVMRTRLGARSAAYLRLAAAALGAAIGAWTLSKSASIVHAAPSLSGNGLPGTAEIRDILGLGIPAVLLAAAVAWLLWSGVSRWLPALVCAALLALTACMMPAAFKQSRSYGSSADALEFAEWTRQIPPASAVLVAPAKDAGALVWFTLNRPNYLALDQSAGVAFSRATALEILRRSEVLLPLMDPAWKILTGLRSSGSGKRRYPAPNRPLTAETLQRICLDRELGFVISPQNVGFDPVRHMQAGEWTDWNLYDCRKVRLATPTA